MPVKLIYHGIKSTSSPSPFDKAAIHIANKSDLRIACPYLSVGYLKRLTSVSHSWQLLTDVEEWLRSLPVARRTPAATFIAENSSRIRNFSRLHAKVVMSATSALIGSANLTQSGIRERTEMAVLLSEESQVVELITWFDELWAEADEIPARESVSAFIESVNDIEPTTTQLNLFSNRRERSASLEVMPEKPHQKPKVHILYYKNARGYYTGHRKNFCVLKGSKVNGSPSAGFGTKYHVGYAKLRDQLIKDGILVRSGRDYEFTKDYVFTASSAAACIVAGGSKSGKQKTWS